MSAGALPGEAIRPAATGLIFAAFRAVLASAVIVRFSAGLEAISTEGWSRKTGQLARGKLLRAVTGTIVAGVEGVDGTRLLADGTAMEARIDASSGLRRRWLGSSKALVYDALAGIDFPHAYWR
jgi:hypothetical protein